MTCSTALYVLDLHNTQQAVFSVVELPAERILEGRFWTMAALLTRAGRLKLSLLVQHPATRKDRNSSIQKLNEDRSAGWCTPLKHRALLQTASNHRQAVIMTQQGNGRMW